MFKILKKNNLFVKSLKCLFNQHLIKFLRYIINSGGIFINDSKVKIIKDWLRLNNRKKLKGFI